MIKNKYNVNLKRAYLPSSMLMEKLKASPLTWQGLLSAVSYKIAIQICEFQIKSI